RPLGLVPGVATGHHLDERLLVVQVRLHGSTHRLLLAVADDQDDPRHAGHLAGSPDRPGHHRHAGQGQQHLVDLGADAGPRACGQHDHGRAHPSLTGTIAVAMAATPSPRPVRPRPSVVVALTDTLAPTASDRAATASSRRWARRGRLPMTWTATFPIS